MRKNTLTIDIMAVATTRTQSAREPLWALQNLSQASRIKEEGTYSISTDSVELEPRMTKGTRSAQGRTFEGVPTITGVFEINTDGTFTQLRDASYVAWFNQLYVTPEAAEKAAKGTGPLELEVTGPMTGSRSRLMLRSVDSTEHTPRLSSVFRN